MNEYKSYCITVRPRLGLSKETEKALIAWFNKQDFAFACIEMDHEARHCHAQIWMENARPKGIIRRSLVRICERTIPEWDNSQSKVLSGGIKIAYDDWHVNYLQENENKINDTVNVIYNNVPNNTQCFYPSIEE